MSGSTMIRLAPLAGLAGSLVTVAASLAAAIAYRGSRGEPYSPLSHWVSELGEIGVSSLALLFNAGLMVGGLCFAVFMVGLAARRAGALGSALGLLGAVAGAAGVMVGIFPINTLTPHAIAAATFFNLAWLAVALASLDIARRPEAPLPRRLAVLGAFTFVAYVGFLVALAGEGILGVEALGPPAVRRAFWPVSSLEWLTLVGILGWVTVASLTWRRPGAAGAG